eukprot:comp21978_c0_seq1/m.31753 comp21978_c0_seq1/g.31753  ORF comp21978_c0_seq1/g.31753 comp21978_c0_seq1/m.31753 type:complete len:371 (-) comp21978_c0_seq1:51-1163(-)
MADRKRHNKAPSQRPAKRQRAGGAAEEGDGTLQAASVNGGQQAAAGAGEVPAELLSWNWSREWRESLKTQGIEWKKGKYTAAETKRLRSNIEAYCEGHGLDAQTLVLTKYTKRASPEHADFWRTAAQGLQRPLRFVQRYARRLYDTDSTKGTFSQQEDDQLLELAVSCDKRWTEIGDKMGRRARAVQARHDYLTGIKNNPAIKQGPWADDEHQRLVAAVFDLTGLTTPGQHGEEDIPWQLVAPWVGTRAAKQCEIRWTTVGDHIHAQRGGRGWSRAESMNLVQRLQEAGYEHESEIRWRDIADFGWSSRYLALRFTQLKARAPPELRTDLQGLLEWLATVGIYHVRPMGRRLRPPDHLQPIIDSDVSDSD